MSNRNPGVDAYIAKSAEFARPILVQIRDVVHAACPETEETLKWGFPHFMYGNRVLCSMAAFKAHCSFGFWRELREAAGKLNAKQEAMGQLGRISSIADLPSAAALTRMVKDAMKLSAAGSGAAPKTTRKPVRELAVPDYFLKALKKRQAALARFKGLAPSHRNEYIQWITEAKTDATREKRMATAVEWIAEGKSRNWKYDRK